MLLVPILPLNYQHTRKCWWSVTHQAIFPPEALREVRYQFLQLRLNGLPLGETEAAIFSMRDQCTNNFATHFASISAQRLGLNLTCNCQISIQFIQPKNVITKQSIHHYMIYELCVINVYILSVFLLLHHLLLTQVPCKDPFLVYLSKSEWIFLFLLLLLLTLTVCFRVSKTSRRSSSVRYFMLMLLQMSLSSLARTVKGVSMQVSFPS